ncbi:MAG: carboxypeptidase M32 [Amoebophilaceae bacterium]|nr:carboxypeptidase M32 [Amoebophilaceae bacterium]
MSLSLYENFVEKFTHIRLLRQIERLLKWDYETCMPVAAVEIRAKQLAYLNGLIHQESTSQAYRSGLEEMVDLATGTIKLAGVSPIEASNLTIWSKDLLRLTRLPISFIETFTAAKINAVKVWKQAKLSSDFSLFSPWLQKIVDLNKKQADLLGYVDSPYDALIDLYEPGMTASTLSTIFDDLAPFLSSFIKKEAIQDSPYAAYFDHDFSAEDQRKFNQLLLDTINVPSTCTRLDFSVHPFCMGMHPTDVRLTTHLGGGLLQNIFAVLHEAGHALYELGFSKEAWNTPAAQPISMAVHESQSRWWEVMIGHSLPFWTYIYPTLQAYFPQLKGLSLSNFYQHINHIKPSCIRIYADEVTYPLHIILRFEIERQLIEGNISAADVPDLWNNKMKDLLGIVPDNDAMGCLQDTHWASGSFGYFPTYALGNIYAAQYFTAFSAAFPDWKVRVAGGSFLFIKEWLHNNIHQYGRRYDTAESMQRVTGQSIALDAYKDYITKKYR